jgi:hypothetical protein
MIESVITLLIWICVIALVLYLVQWVLTTVLGVALPAQAVHIIWVILV